MLQLREHKEKNIAGIFSREPHIKLKKRKKKFVLFSNFSFVLPLTMHMFIQGSNEK